MKLNACLFMVLMGLGSTGCTSFQPRLPHKPRGTEVTPPTASFVADPVPLAITNPMPSPAPVAPIQQVQNQTPVQPVSAVNVPETPTPASIQQRFAQAYAQMTSYGMRFKRRESVDGKSSREELILAKFRAQPHSVYMKWIGEEGKGREVAFVQGQYEGKIHTILAPGDMPFMGGKRFSVAPDSVLVKNQSRYPITDAGFGPLLGRYTRVVQQGSVRYEGKANRPEFDQPMDLVLQTVTSGEALLPKGGRRLWFFDGTTGLPGLVLAYDDQNREVEYYCYDRIQSPLNLDADDFNPDKLWGKR